MTFGFSDSAFLSAATGRYDSDARDYFRRVQLAGSSINATNRRAFDYLVRDLKSASLLDKLGTALALAGPDTLAGALVPLMPGMPVPTSYNFVEGDYSRTAGLKGNGTNKYLDTGYGNATDPQNDNHNSVMVSEANSVGAMLMGAGGSGAGSNNLGSSPNGAHLIRSRSNTPVAVPASGVNDTGFFGHSRSSSESVTFRVRGSDFDFAAPSSAPAAAMILVYQRGSASPAWGDARLAWASAGASLPLSTLDAILTAYTSRLQ